MTLCVLPMAATSAADAPAAKQEKTGFIVDDSRVQEQQTRAPLETDSLSLCVLDAKGEVAPVGNIHEIKVLIEKDRRRSLGEHVHILERNPDGSVEIERKFFSLARKGMTMQLRFSTGKGGPTVTAKGIYPGHDAGRLQFRTAEAMPTQEAPPTGLGPSDAAVLVVDGQGNPIRGAVVNVIRTVIPLAPWRVKLTTTTDAAGTAVLKDIGELYYRYLEIRAKGFAPCWKVRALPGRTLRVQLDSTTRLAGKFLLPNGQPAGETEMTLVCKKLISAEGAEIEIPGILLQHCTGEEAEYDFMLEPGLYDVEVLSKTGHFMTQTELPIERGKVNTVPSALRPAARLELHITDSLTGKPVTDAGFFLCRTVAYSMWHRPGSERISNSDGVVVWDALVPGRTWVEFDKSKYARGWSDKSLAARGRNPTASKPQLCDGINTLVFDVSKGMPPIEVVLERAVTVDGVICGGDGKPVADARVDVCQSGKIHPFTADSRYGQQTSANGTYRLSLPAGNGIAYHIIAHDPQHRWANAISTPFESRPGDTFSFDLVMPEGGQVSGRVVDTNGKAVSDVEVEALPSDGLDNAYYIPRAVTDSEGRFTLTAMRSGTYMLYPDAVNGVNTRRAGSLRPAKVQERARTPVGNLIWGLPRPTNP
jgi:hypothetical protein